MQNWPCQRGIVVKKGMTIAIGLCRDWLLYSRHFKQSSATFPHVVICIGCTTEEFDCCNLFPTSWFHPLLDDGCVARTASGRLANFLCRHLSATGSRGAIDRFAHIGSEMARIQIAEIASR